MEKTNEKPLESNIFSTVKKDCFAYGRLNEKCSILTETVCKTEFASFTKQKENLKKGE